MSRLVERELARCAPVASSPMELMPVSPESEFCEELNGSLDTAFTRIYQGRPASRIIDESAELVALSDLSPLTPGHVLVVPRSYYPSFAAVLGEHGSGVLSLLHSVRSDVARAFGETVVMEHGSTTGMRGGACISHAHLHVLPLRGALALDLMKRDGIRFRRLSELAGLAALSSSERPYLFFSHQEMHWVASAEALPRPQYLRSVAGRVLGMSDLESDYAMVVRREYGRRTLLTLRRRAQSQ